VSNLYQVLGVRPGAPDEEIKAAFRSLAKQLHPDLHPGDTDAERQFQDVARAYETLGDPPSRVAYDAGLARQRSLRRWRFRAVATTMLTVLALTVSVGVFWRDLSAALRPAEEHHAARLSGKEAPTAKFGTADTASPEQEPAPEAVVRSEDAPTNIPELKVEPVDGKFSQIATADAPPPQSPPLADDASVGHSLIPSNETVAPESWAPRAPFKTQNSGVGWWVVVGSFNLNSASTLLVSSIRHANGAAHQCGLGVFNDLSSTFHGFTPGYIVVVIGPFADKAEATRSQQQVNGCVSGSYLKYAQHLGQ
jgi:hypothetical protein